MGRGGTYGGSKIFRKPLGVKEISSFFHIGPPRFFFSHSGPLEAYFLVPPLPVGLICLQIAPLQNCLDLQGLQVPLQ